MDKFIYTIFDNLQEELQLLHIAEENISKEIIELLKPLKDSISTKEYEEIRSLFYQTGYLAEREGFVAGFEFAVQLLAESLKQN